MNKFKILLGVIAVAIVIVLVVLFVRREPETGLSTSSGTMKVIDVVIDDSDGGNGNFVLNRGETFNLFISLQNLSNVQATTMSVAKLTATHAGLTVLDNISSYPGAAVGDTAFTGAFRCALAADVQDDTVTAEIALASEQAAPPFFVDEVRLGIQVNASGCIKKSEVVQVSGQYRLRIWLAVCNREAGQLTDVGVRISGGDLVECGSDDFFFTPVGTSDRCLYGTIDPGDCNDATTQNCLMFEYNIGRHDPNVSIGTLKCITIQGTFHTEVNDCDFSRAGDEGDFSVWSRIYNPF